MWLHYGRLGLANQSQTNQRFSQLVPKIIFMIEILGTNIYYSQHRLVARAYLFLHYFERKIFTTISIGSLYHVIKAVIILSNCIPCRIYKEYLITTLTHIQIN